MPCIPVADRLPSPDPDLDRRVHQLRLGGATWAQVADLVGTSLSGAHRRWRHLDDLVLDVTCAATGLAVCATASRRRRRVVLEHLEATA